MARLTERIPKKLSTTFAILMLFAPCANAQTVAAAVLPVSRSVQVGTLATAFATILNTGSITGTGCRPSPLTPVAATFIFQITNSSTNQVIGTPNTPVDIPSGAAQTFVFGFTPTAPFSPTDLQLEFKCSNTSAAPIISGVNTFLLSASSSAVPDLIAVGLTISNDGIAGISWNQGTGIFVIASSNIGISAAITVRARLSDASLPITTLVCETNPITGLCKQTPAASVTRTINANENTTWTAFLQGSGSVAFDPAHSRVFFEFVDAGGIVRGSTSAAVSTRIPTRGLWVQFERRGWPSEYWPGQVIQQFSDFDSVVGHKVSDEVALQLDAMRGMGVNTLTLELRTADAFVGATTFPSCQINSVLGFHWPQPTPTELANLTPFLDLISSKGFRIILVLTNTHMEEQPPTNSQTWLGAILNIVKNHPALDFVVLNGDTHTVDTNGDGVADSCGGQAETPLYLGPQAKPATYVKWAINYAMSLGVPALKLSAGTIVGDFFTDSQPPAGPDATDRHLWTPIGVMKSVFDSLGIPDNQRVYALSFYEHRKCSTAQFLACIDADPATWADQTLQGVFSRIGTNNGGRVVAYEMGNLNPVASTWPTESALANLVTVMEKYGADGGSFWRWTSFSNGEDADPTQAQPIKRRGTAFTYNPVQSTLLQAYH